MTSAGSRAFSCRTPPRTSGQFAYPPYPSATPAAMTPSPTRYYSPGPAAAGYYRPVMYPTQPYGGSPSKQRKGGRGKYDEVSQVMLPDSTTLTPPSSVPMKKSSIQVSLK